VNNPELSTGLTPIKEPTAEELNARRELSRKMETQYGENAVASRVASLEHETATLKAMRDQPLEGPKQSPEIGRYIDEVYKKDSAEVRENLRRLQREPEPA